MSSVARHTLICAAERSGADASASDSVMTSDEASAVSTESKIALCSSICSRVESMSSMSGSLSTISSTRTSPWTPLELMRGARLWDVEHRDMLLGRYRDLFEAMKDVVGAPANDLRIGASHGSDTWQIDLRGRELAGSARWQPEAPGRPNGRVVARQNEGEVG